MIDCNEYLKALCDDIAMRRLPANECFKIISARGLTDDMEKEYNRLWDKWSKEGFDHKEYNNMICTFAKRFIDGDM